jgi:hypothetical protein
MQRCRLHKGFKKKRVRASWGGGNESSQPRQAGLGVWGNESCWVVWGNEYIPATSGRLRVWRNESSWGSGGMSHLGGLGE